MHTACTPHAHRGCTTQVRYEAVLQATCLDTDIARMPAGDLTEVGEGGSALSGGQRARIGLARLAYRDVDTYVIDDPLSALDPHVGQQVFELTLCRLLSGKRRILVTHQLQCLHHAAIDQVAVLSEGRIKACGSYGDVRASGALDSTQAQFVNGTRFEVEAAVIVKASIPSHSATMSSRRHAEERRRCMPAGAVGPFKFIEAEGRATGVIQPATYMAWARAAGWPMLALSVAIILATQLLALLGSVFLLYWGTLPQTEQQRVLHSESLEPLLLWMPWWALLLLTCGFAFSYSELFFRLSLRASHRLHEAALLRLLHAPVLFFDANPLGRILNRFSSDVEFCDSLLPTTTLDVLISSLLVISSLSYCLVVAPWIAAVLLPITPYFMWLRKVSLASSREIKRLDGLSRSPIFGAFAESLSGVATIRALDGMAALVTARFNSLQDANSRTYFHFLASGRWLGLRLDAICSMLLIFGTSAVIAATSLGGGGNAGLLGSALVFLARLADSFQWAVRQTAELENQMVSVERLVSYAQLPQEPPLTTAAPPPIDWPQHGHLLFHNVSMRFRPELAPTLENVCFEVAAGSLVGVCGRSGAGKSSLIAALFRLSEPHGGTIEIDGINCGTIGLHELRPKLALIMQSPFLFAGSIADNLSPLKAYSDAELWETLELVQLKKRVASLDGGLRATVSDGGASLSVGERQLLCLARALLLRTKVLLLDEATANIDTVTDALIQRTVRDQFHESTVIMIAHRMLTITDVNQILLLSEGRVYQSGPPAQLLQKPPDVARVNFSSMVEDAGLTLESFEPSRAVKKAMDY